MNKPSLSSMFAAGVLALLMGWQNAVYAEEAAAEGEAAANAEEAAAEEEEELTGEAALLNVEKKNKVKMSGKTEWEDPTLEPRKSEIMPLAVQANTLGVARSSVGYVAVGERGHILVSVDGKDWEQIVSPSRSKLNDVWFEDDDHGWAYGNDATILETKDGGMSWELRHFDGLAEPLYDMIDLSSDEYLVVGRRGTAMISRDRGRTWEKIENDVTDFQFHFFSVTRIKDGTIWVTGETGFVVKVTEGGETWDKVVSPYTGSLFGMLPLGRYGFVAYGLRGNVFVVRNHFRLQSEDLEEYDEFDIENIEEEDELAELGWEKVDSGTTQSLFGGAVTATGEVFLVGVNGTGTRSSERVKAFQPVDLKLNYSLSDVILLGSRALVVGQFGPAWVTMN